MKTLCCTDADSIGLNVLSELANLELLVYGKNDRTFLRWFNYWAANDFIDYLMEEKKRLKRADLQVVFVETPIAEDSRFADYEFDKVYGYFNL